MSYYINNTMSIGPFAPAATWHGADVILGGYDNVELHGLGSSINCLGRRVTSYTTRDPKEIAKLLAMLP